jgi:decaprenyl-phosphate phosphoribosyltransferase
MVSLRTAQIPLYRRFNINSFEVTADEQQVRLPLRRETAPLTVLEGGEDTATRSRGGLIGVLVRACRPRQWSKNLLVLAAPCAAGVIDRPAVAAQVAGAFLSLCLLSSATYLINDVRDLEQDRLHPRKRTRPVAAGELSVVSATRAALVMALLGLGLALAIAPALAAVGAGYLALTVSYSLWWRRIVIADILAIAAGFVLRALAGGAATDIYLSRWFVIVTACCAVFLVAAKRYAELREHTGVKLKRATLHRYSPGRLRLTLAAAASVAGIAYVGWAFSRPSHLVWYGLSIIPFVMWLARYASLIGAGAGEAPEELILRDRTLLALSLLWGLLFLGGVYVGH